MTNTDDTSDRLGILHLFLRVAGMVRPIRAAGCHFLRKLFEDERCIMRPRRGLRVELDAMDHSFRIGESLDRPIIQIRVCDLDSRRERL